MFSFSQSHTTNSGANAVKCSLSSLSSRLPRALLPWELLPWALLPWVLLAGVFVCAGASALELRGERVQGGLLYGQAQAGQHIYYRDQSLQLDAQQRFIVALDRDADAALILQAKSEVGVGGNGGKGSKGGEADKRGGEGCVTREYHYEIAAREYPTQHIEGVAKKYVAPDPEQVARSRREARLVGQARKQQREQNDFFEGFIWPVTGPITGVFGSQRVYNGEPRRPHYGVDVARPTGTPVVAPASGLITLAEPDLYFSGGTLIIDHGHGLSSTFLHLSELLVEPGQRVEQGEPVAEIGATGRVTGAHLDWRMNWTGSGRNVRLDPQLLVAPMEQFAEAE